MAHIYPLCPELAIIAETELGEVPSRIETDIEHLRQWLLKQRHIRARVDDKFLLAFLRGCKFSLERVKEKIDMYYTIRTAVPEFFSNRDPSDPINQHAMKQGITLPLPYTKAPDSARIMLIRMGSFNPREVTVPNFMKICYMITDVLIWEDPNTSVVGHTIIVDLRGVSFSQLAQFPATLIRKMTTGVQEAYPIRQKGIHFVNPPLGFDALYKIFYTFLKEKFRKRIFVHDSFEALHKEIPKHLLPKEYGGESGDISGIIDYWSDVLLKRRNFFLEEENFKSDERYRIGKSNAVFGTDGSFRSLDVD